ncbi:unnamed protein product [Rotaria socialis]|uniref:Uncharacterized protein n=1 Tax=Rotaria socialis TaxID=392032 RepID=A0A820ZLC6_9BILA|nr:unnamed protein product [Rotaria socialis]CAF4563989.1 unnamed protein product [Rotaria socialis]
MARILLSTNYPNLYGLGLHNLEQKMTEHLFSELRVSLENFIDCLYSRDGRFNLLRTFHVNINKITRSQLIENKGKLLNLRCFVLYCDLFRNAYDESIVPLLDRMLNLEELSLTFEIVGRNKFIDGNNLKDIIDHMIKLICRQMKIFKAHSEIFSMARVGRCHIYSYPYQLKMYEQITNNFSGGLFECVCAVSLFDERPFAHAFFLRIAQSFPLMKKLKLVNLKPQNNKQCRKPEHDDRDCSIVKYPHLNDLDLFEVHANYIEQFLMDTKTCLPYRVVLVTNHQLLENVTHHFKSDTTRINCSKIYYLYSDTVCSLPEHVKDYFFNTGPIMR